MAAIVGWLWPLQGPPTGTYVGTSPVEKVGLPMLLILVFLLLATHGLRRRKPAEERREVAFSAGDFSVLDEVVAEGFFDHLGQRRGPEGFKRSVASLRRTFPYLHVSIEEQSVEGDTVTTRCTLRGMDRGGVLWYPPTGKRANFAATYTDRFAGGMPVEHRGRSDTASLLEQLGLPSCGAQRSAREGQGARGASSGLVSSTITP